MAIPVTLADAKRQLRYEAAEPISADRQAELEGFIADAAGWVGHYTGHILAAREVTETFDGFERLRLRAWPIKPDAVPAVSYRLRDGTPATPIVGAFLSVSRRPALVWPARATCWPRAATFAQVSVTVRAGYEDADPLPPPFRRAMLVLIGGYDADRTGGGALAQAEAAAQRLCRDYRGRSL